jgi:hypothetical protein
MDLHFVRVQGNRFVNLALASDFTVDAVGGKSGAGWHVRLTFGDTTYSLHDVDAMEAATTFKKATSANIDLTPTGH